MGLQIYKGKIVLQNFSFIVLFLQVKAVVIEFEELISSIKADHKILKKVEEPLSINIFTTSGGAGKSTTGVNGQFVFSQVLIDCLLRLKTNPTDKNELISLCTKEYQGNKTELAILQEFEQGYSPDRALWWYTRESFLYRLLNKALRVQNIDLLFVFRFFIRDIRQQLEQY